MQWWDRVLKMTFKLSYDIEILQLHVLSGTYWIASYFSVQGPTLIQTNLEV